MIGIAWWSSAQGVMGGRRRGLDTLTVSQFHMVSASGDRKLNFLLSINLKVPPGGCSGQGLGRWS